MIEGRGIGGALVKTMAKLDDALTIVERLGLSWRSGCRTWTRAACRCIRVTVPRPEDEWFHTPEEQAEFLRRKAAEVGRELVVGDETRRHGQRRNGEERYYPKELHKVREVNRGLEELRRFGLAPTDLLPPLRLAGREPAPRLVLESGDQRRPLTHLRELVATSAGWASAAWR